MTDLAAFVSRDFLAGQACQVIADHYGISVERVAELVEERRAFCAVDGVLPGLGA